MTGQVIGYVRVSSAEQNEARQVETLANASRLFVDKLSGKNSNRSALTEMLAKFVKATPSESPAWTVWPATLTTSAAW